MIFKPKPASILILGKKIVRDISIFHPILKTGGENDMYYMTSAVTRIGGRNVNMGHFIGYVFTEDEIIMYDEKTVKRKTGENLSSNFNF